MGVCRFATVLLVVGFLTALTGCVSLDDPPLEIAGATQVTGKSLLQMVAGKTLRGGYVSDYGTINLHFADGGRLFQKLGNGAWWEYRWEPRNQYILLDFTPDGRKMGYFLYRHASGEITCIRRVPGIQNLEGVCRYTEQFKQEVGAPPDRPKAPTPPGRTDLSNKDVPG